MKIRLLMYLEHNRITEKEKEEAGVIEFSCDWCDSTERIEFNTYIDYLDMLNIRFKELHYLCEKCLAIIMQKFIKEQVIDI